MGFIDYHGTKEDRFSDVLEYAKAQQEEEQRRLEDERIGRWISKFTGDVRFAELSMPDLIKYVIVRYRQLHQLYNQMMSGDIDPNLDSNQLWNYYCIWMVSNRFDEFSMEESKRITYLQTFSDKVFKLTGVVSAEKHFEKKSSSIAYQKFLTDSYSLVGEKNFWKWLNNKSDNKEQINTFWNMYLQLITLISYYFYHGLHPQSDGWIHKLETEKRIIEQLEEAYKEGKKYALNIDVLRYPSAKSPVNIIKKGLDRSILESLLDKKSLHDFSAACSLVYEYGLVPPLSGIYEQLIERIPILENTIIRFKDNYQADLDLFYDFYIPEALTLTANYIEYRETGIHEKTLSGIEESVIDACDKLLVAVNDKINEICRFASIDIKASAKALESIMSQNGHVNPAYKIKGGSQIG